MTHAELSRAYDFTGKTVLVTGGTGVLGGAIAEGLLECGATVALLARDPSRARPLLERAGRAAARVLVLQGDVLDRETLVRARADLLSATGRLDALVNAAGGNAPGASTAADRRFFDLPPDAVRWVFDLNVLGTLLPTQVFGEVMAERGEGVVLNLSSMSALRPLTRVVAYSAAKAAVSSFTQWLAVHLAQEYSPRLRVNALAPGFFLTTQNRFLLQDEATGQLTARGESILAHTPMRRFGAPDDLLGAALWLLSPASAFVTGVVLPVDGGFAAFSGV